MIMNKEKRSISLILISIFILFTVQKYSFTTKAQKSFSCDNVTEIPKIECEALVALYNSTDGANWYDNDGWLNTNTPCSWKEIECSDGHIIELDLDYNSLRGNIPADLGNLTNLQQLYLNNNQLSGNIPADLGNLTNLQRLYLSRNQLSGSIPAALGNLTRLDRLFLYNNQLSGALPQNMTNLELYEFLFHDTNLCEPANGVFQNWLNNIGYLESTNIFCSLVRGVTIASVRDQATGSESIWLQKAQDMGVSVVHIPLAWQSLEVQQDKYEWAQLDDILKQVRYYNLLAILRVYHAPPWYTPFGAELTAPPTDPQVLYNFMQAMVSHIDDKNLSQWVAGYVIWNEPNIPEQWGGNAADPAHYMALLKAAYQGAKTVDSEVFIVSAPLAPTATGNGAIDDLTYLAQLYDQPDSLTDYADYVGLNGLGFQFDPDYDPRTVGYNFSRLKYLHEVMLVKGDTDRQVWVLETGWLRDSPYDMSSFEDFKVSERQQAEYLARAFHKAETEWSDWVNLMVAWNLGYDHYYPPSSNFHWYSIANTLAEVYLTSVWRPEIQTLCGTSSDDTPTIFGIAPTNSTVTLYVDGTVQGTTIASSGQFSHTLFLESRPTQPYIIQVQANHSNEMSELSKPLTLTVDTTLPFNPLDLVFTWQYGQNYTALRQPRDSEGCVNPEGWRLPQLPSYRSITLTVPINAENCLSPLIELAYRGQVISDFVEIEKNLFQANFSPANRNGHNSLQSFNLQITYDGVPHDFSGDVALIEPEGIVYDATLGLTSPIAQATVTLYAQHEIIDWSIWDAWHYSYQGQSQVNPQVTEVDGYYSFMVPAGSYMLQVVADGYYPYNSDLIQVVAEPIHLDTPLIPVLDIPLIPVQQVYLPLILR